jgi:hypothetical protein
MGAIDRALADHERAVQLQPACEAYRRAKDATEQLAQSLGLSQLASGLPTSTTTGANGQRGSARAIVGESKGPQRIAPAKRRGPSRPAPSKVATSGVVVPSPSTPSNPAMAMWERSPDGKYNYNGITVTDEEIAEFLPPGMMLLTSLLH